MFRLNNCRKFLSGLLFAIAAPGLINAQSKPNQSKPGQSKPAQSKPQPKPAQTTMPVPDAKPKNNFALSFLSLEVNALQTLRQFQFDNDQLSKLINAAHGPLGKAGGTITPNRARLAGNASNNVREKMMAIRKALLDLQSNADIPKMTTELAALLEKENASIDDNIEISDAARREAVSIYRQLRVDQLASYIGQIADSIEDPVEQFMGALEQAGSLSDDEWKEQQHEIVEEIAQAAAGVDAAKVKNLSEELLPLLAKARTIKKDDLEKQMPELEKAAKKVIGEISAETVLRNRAQVDLATLLSNSQVINACRGMIKSNNDAKTATEK